MSAIRKSYFDQGQDELARVLSSYPLPKFKLKDKVDASEEIKKMLEIIPKTLLERGKIIYPDSPIGHASLKDSPERRLIFLASLHLLNPEKLFNYCNKISGVDIIDISNSGDQKKCCDWFVFKDDPWFYPAQKNLFSPHAVEFLELNGYQRIEKPEVGAIAVYFHGENAFKSNAGRAAHYGKIVEINENGEAIIESKFVDSHVFRHRQDLVLPYFGSEIVYLKKKT